VKNSFENKVVLVTDGTSDIGFEIIKRFSEEGAYVITCGRDNEKGVKATNNWDDRNIIFNECNIGIKSDIENLFGFIKEKYSKLDIAVNNVNCFCIGKSLHEYSLEELNEIINVNLIGTFLCMQEEIKVMLKSNNGAIVNILSNASINAEVYGSTPYIFSKHVETGLTKVAAFEYAGKGIRVNGVLPGLTDTDMLRQNVNEKMKNGGSSWSPLLNISINGIQRLSQYPPFCRAVFRPSFNKLGVYGCRLFNCPATIHI
jgi:NAD(P)-dependent dehydrogenase (short-subunit alcohol dehydrogenase family)